MLENPDPDTEAVDKVITPTSLKEQEELTRQTKSAWLRLMKRPGIEFDLFFGQAAKAVIMEGNH